ncbi:hypothetical protein [Pseudostreptobacillus hongkongensis]|uniref:hypothetical protein n=1 Tax=Pseudostreptobacillus hongkongensis TaxID=1162717 RepID=UPI0028D15689|nr:hypothetical protein [Pseudostreptobacillus hongkongensis]
MDKKKLFIKKGLEKINEIQNILLEIQIPKEEDFAYLTKLINEIENDTFFIGNVVDIDFLSIIKKVLIYIERYSEQYFEFKYDIYNSLINLEEVYKNYLKSNFNSFESIELRDNIYNLSKKLDEVNKNKAYYYIKFYFDNSVPYFYLSRRNILTRLKEYGKPYNYIPFSLDDDRYSYFIVDYKVNDSVDVKEVIDSISLEDEGISSYVLNKIENNKNIYNIKIYCDIVDDNILNDIKNNIFEDKHLLDIIEYRNILDIYVYAKNQLEITEKLFNINNSKIHSILSKNINNRETRVFTINGINKENVDKIKDVIAFNITDKKIVDVVYDRNIDFYGRQFLEYLKVNYNIENGIFRKIK